MAKGTLTQEQIDAHVNTFVQDIECAILEDIFEFSGTKDDLQRLVSALQAKVNEISVDDLFSEFNN